MNPGLALFRAVIGSAASIRAWLHAARYVVRLRTPRDDHRRPSAETSRLLLLCRTFPPALDGGVYRLLALVTAARESGWAVDVVTREPPDAISPGGHELAERIPAGTGVHFWHPPSGLPIARIAPTIDGGFLEIDQIIATARALPAPSVIVASGPMFSEFVAARVLSAETSVPYILSYRDEWTTNLFSFVERGMTDRFWEQFALSDAAAIICATRGMARQLVSDFGTTVKSKVHVIPNGWDPVEPSTRVTPPAASSGEMARSIGFFGTLMEDIDLGVNSFIDDVEQLIASGREFSDTIRFRFVGRKSPTISQRLGTGLIAPMAVDVEHQPVSIVRNEMRQCLGLLLLNGPKAARAIPGKAFEYIAARRPILVYGEGGDSGELFAGVPGARIIRAGDPEELGRAIAALASGALDRELEERSEALVEATSRAARSVVFLDLLRSVAQETATTTSDGFPSPDGSVVTD